MADMKQVADRLMERTSQNQVDWRTTADPSTFAAVIGNSSVLISSPADKGLSSLARVLTAKVKLSVLDEEGREIDYIEHEVDGFDNNPQLLSLYYEAKRAALDVDQRLNDLLTALEREP